MIKVNLLKNKAELTQAAPEAAGDPIKIDQVLSGVTINNNSQTLMLLKLIIICGGVAGLFVYERVKINNERFCKKKLDEPFVLMCSTKLAVAICPPNTPIVVGLFVRIV